MGRGRLLNSIPDLQIEYGGEYGTHSIRDFLISVKGFSERQYRHIIAHAPASEWHVRRGEIQNSIAANKIERLTEEAVEINYKFVETARVGLFKATQFMARAVDPSNGGLTPEELLNCLKSVQATQEVFMRAMGVKKGEGLTQIFESVQRRAEAISKVGAEAKPNLPLENLSYDDVMTLIEIRREQKSSARTRAVRP